MNTFNLQPGATFHNTPSGEDLAASLIKHGEFRHFLALRSADAISVSNCAIDSRCAWLSGLPLACPVVASFAWVCKSASRSTRTTAITAGPSRARPRPGRDPRGVSRFQAEAPRDAIHALEVVPDINGAFVERMEDVLRVYARLTSRNAGTTSGLSR